MTAGSAQEAAGTTVGTLRREAARKAIHLTGLALPAIYVVTPRRPAVIILAALATTSVAIDYVRHRHAPTASVFNGLFDPVLRVHERDREARNLTAVSWFFISAALSAALFPKYITIASVTMSLPADAASALVGTAWGRHRFLGKGGKSIEGSVAFFIAAVLVMIAMPKIDGSFGEYLIGAAAALVGTVAELVSVRRVDDNLTVPLGMAVCLWALYRWAFPHMDLRFGV